MLTSNVVIWSPLWNFLVPLRPPPTEAGCNWLELPLVVQEQFFRRVVGYVFFMESAANIALLLINKLELEFWKTQNLISEFQFIDLCVSMLILLWYF